MKVWLSGGRGLRRGAGTGLRKGLEIAGHETPKANGFLLTLPFSPFHRGMAYCSHMVEGRDVGVTIIDSVS